MGVFFIDYEQGRVATAQQLREAGIGGPDGTPPAPWRPINATGDATTMWYAVLRREEKGVFIGTLAFRHSDRHASLLQRGWQEVPLEEIGVDGATTTYEPGSGIFPAT